MNVLADTSIWSLALRRSHSDLVGIAGAAVDFLVCSVAIRRGWEIFTLDQDFERYASRIPLALYRFPPL